MRNPFRLKNDMSIRQFPSTLLVTGVRTFRFSLTLRREILSETFKANLGHRGEGAHSLRHNFESRMRATDPNPGEALLGHTFPNMTARYGT